jgi:hypothetical protein
LDEGNDGFRIGLRRLQELVTEQEVLQKKLEFARLNLEDTERRAKKARDLFEDAGLEMWKS